MRTQSQQFAEWVECQARKSRSDPLYTGDHLKDIVEYLNRPLRHAATTKVYRARIDRPVAHVYDLNNVRHPPTCYTRAGDFEDDCDVGKAISSPALVFLTGHATPEWINAVGGELNMDILHLLGHLNFRPSVRQTSIAIPGLSSLSTSLLRLNVPTIGRCEPGRARLSTVEMQKLRRQCATKVHEHLKSTDWTLSAGSPILRRLYLLTPSTFVVEQDITISLLRNDSRWTLLVWCDCSGDGERPSIPLDEIPGFGTCSFVMEPVVQFRRRLQAPANGESDRRFSAHTEQSLAMLPGNYGRMLDASLAASDPFYVLYELLDFVASAEWQFVQVVTAHISEQQNLSVHESLDSPSFSDFQYIMDLLESHASNLNRLLTVLRHPERLGWPVCDSAQGRARANKAQCQLIEDFTGLHHDIQALIRKCERGKDVVLGNAGLRVSRQSFLLEVALSRLTIFGTWIAVFYGPLSFITSVFGMNFREFGQGTLSISLWGVVVASILCVYAISVAFWKRHWILERLY